MEENGGTPLLEKLVPILLIVSIALAFLVGVLWQKVGGLENKGVLDTTTADTTQPTQPEIKQASLDDIKKLFDKDLIKFGDNKKKLLFVEVSDPSCPYCHIAGGHNPELSASADARFKYKSDGGSYVPPVPEMKKLVDEGKASYVYIYTSGHGNGELGTKAMYCAYDQDKFWPVHDKLMTNAGYTLLNEKVKNDLANVDQLITFLKGTADTGKLKECLESKKYDSRIASDSQIASEIGVTGTPGFYANDKFFAGAYSFTEMQSAVDSALK